MYLPGEFATEDVGSGGGEGSGIGPTAGARVAGEGDGLVQDENVGGDEEGVGAREEEAGAGINK